MHQAGLIDHAVRKSSQIKGNPCSKNKNKDQEENTTSKPMMLKLRHFSVAFVILGSGLFLAAIVLFFELIFRWIKLLLKNAE